MNMDNTSGIVPSLRFNGFSGDWKEKKLGEIGDFKKGQPLSKGELDNNGKNLCIHYGELFTKYNEIITSIFSKTDSPVRVGSVYGDILFPASDVTPTGLARCSTLLLDNVLLGGDIIILRPKGNDCPTFLSYAINNQKKAIVRLVAGAVVKHITPSELANLSIFLPPTIDEQKKIAACLMEEDEMILEGEKKVTCLKVLKKGIIQQLFPQKDESTPRLRFPGFIDEWKERPLSDFLFEHKSKSDGKCEVHSVSVSNGVVNQIEYLGRSFAAADTSKYNLVKPNDIVYTKSPTGDFPYGIIKQNKNPYNVIVSPLYAVYTPVSKYLGYILDSYFENPVNTNNYLSSLVQKGAKNTIQISNDTFVSKKLRLPSDPSEQRIIAECLAALDETIASEIAKLEALKAHKKGLMQQLFPQS